MLEPNFVAGISGLTFKNNEKKPNFVIQWWCQFNGNRHPLKSPNCKLNDCFEPGQQVDGHEWVHKSTCVGLA